MTPSTVNEKVHEARRTASQMVGQAGTTSEEALHHAATTVRNAGAKGGDALDSFAETAGRKFAKAASYLEPSAESCSMVEDIRKMFFRHPGACMVAAAAFAGALGFMAGSGASKHGNGRSGY